MSEPIFDHEKLDVYRLSIEYVAACYETAKGLAGANRHIRDPWLRGAQSIPLTIAEGNGKQSLKDKNRFYEIARGSALQCPAIHDMLADARNRRHIPVRRLTGRAGGSRVAVRASGNVNLKCLVAALAERGVTSTTLWPAQLQQRNSSPRA